MTEAAANDCLNLADWDCQRDLLKLYSAYLNLSGAA